MASSITTTTLDENFPVAGRDNDSQGFRDNFFNIKQNLGFAKSEIEALQNGTARVNTDNNFGGNTINNAILLNVRETVNTTYSTGTVTDIDILWSAGVVHVVRLENDIELTMSSWPATGYASMKLVLFGDNSDRIATISSEGVGTVKTDDSGEFVSDNITVNSSLNPKIVEVFTYDGGTTVFARYLGSFT
jgi:hypothetical protein